MRTLDMEELEHDIIEESYKAPNLEKGMAVLELLSGFSNGKTLQEIRKELSISLTTGYRILLTLVRLGYLSVDEDSKKYRLTQKMLTVGFRSVQEHNLMDKVLPRMRALRDEVKESIFFGVPNEEGLVVMEQSVGTHSFCFYLSPGKQIQLHCSAPGKAMMAFLPEDLREKYLSRMLYERHNQNTISNEADYLRELEMVRRTGIAFDLEEELDGVICVSSPILNLAEMPCGCLWTSGPKSRLMGEDREWIAAKIKAVCRDISKELGYAH